MTLLAAYAFSEGSGNTAADATGNGNTANLSGVTDWTADGHTGSAWSNLIGTGAYGIIPMAGLTFTNAATIEAWVYRENWGETNRRAFGAANAAGTSDGLVIGAAGGTARPLFIVTTTTGYHFIYSDSSWGTLPAGWHHLAGVYDGAEIRVYIDGTLAGTKTGVTGNLDLSTTLGFDIGRNASRTSGHLVGHLDDLRIYNHALSVAEIQTDMNTPVGAATTTTPVTASFDASWAVLTTLLSDDFNRAYNPSVVGPPQIGPEPIVLSGTWGIFSYGDVYASAVTSGEALLVWDLGIQDVEIEILRSTSYPSNIHGVVLAVASATDYLRISFTGSSVALAQRRSGGTVVLASSGLPAQPHIAPVKVGLRDGFIRVKQGDRVLLAYDMTGMFTPSTRHGLRVSNGSDRFDYIIGTQAPDSVVLSQASGYVYRGRDTKALDLAGMV